MGKLLHFRQSETVGRLLHGLIASAERAPSTADDSPYSLLHTSYSLRMNEVTDEYTAYPYRRR